MDALEELAIAEDCPVYARHTSRRGRARRLAWTSLVVSYGGGECVVRLSNNSPPMYWAFTVTGSSGSGTRCVDVKEAGEGVKRTYTLRQRVGWSGSLYALGSALLDVCRIPLTILIEIFV